jgi:hypothetical protein
MECVNPASLHRKSGQWGTQPSLTVKHSKKVTTSRDDKFNVGFDLCYLFVGLRDFVISRVDKAFAWY